MRTVVAVPDQALNHDLVKALAEFPEIELVRQVASFPGPDDLLRIIRARKPDFVFLSTEDFPKFQALAAAIDDRMPGLPVISVSRKRDPIELTPKLMHLGVRELLTSPITHEKLGEIIASIARQLAKHPASPSAEIPGVFPCAVGSGSRDSLAGLKAALEGSYCEEKVLGVTTAPWWSTVGALS